MHGPHHSSTLRLSVGNTLNSSILAVDSPAMGMRRFEYSEGTSNKFWEAWVDRSTVKTRYGKIGRTLITK